MDEPTTTMTVVRSTFAQIQAENVERDRKTKEVRRASLIVALLDALDDVCPVEELCALIADFVPLDWHLKQRAPSPLDVDVSRNSLSTRARYYTRRFNDRVWISIHLAGLPGRGFHLGEVLASSDCNLCHVVVYFTARPGSGRHVIKDAIGLVDLECTGAPTVLLTTPFVRCTGSRMEWDGSSLHFHVSGFLVGAAGNSVRAWICPRTRTVTKITEFPGIWNQITHSGVDLATSWEDGEENVYLCEFLGVRRRILPPLLGFRFSEMHRVEGGIVLLPKDPLDVKVYYQLAMLCGSGVDLPPEGQAYFPLVFPL
jgi:hypothetical protein